MYKYATTDSIFDGVSNIYLVSIATAFLAVIVAFYCSNFFKDESEGLNKTKDEEDNYVTDTEIENSYALNQEHQKEVDLNEFENASDDEDIDAQIRRNSILIYESSDNDEISVDGIISRLKSKRVKNLKAQLTKEQLEEEKRIEREQLAAIFELLKKQEAELNMQDVDESGYTKLLGLYDLQR